MVDSLAIKGEKRKQMLAMSEAQKREMLKGFQSIKTAPSAAEPPSYYVQKLKEQISVSDLGKLTVSLVSKPIDWIESFIQANGLLPLVDLLAKSIDAEPKSKDNLKVIASIITCIKGLMNAHEGAIRSVASVGGSFLALVRALEHVDVKNYRRIWEILGGLTIISPEAHRISLQALQESFRGKDGQTTGLSVLRGALEKGDLNTRPVALCFANALINRSTSIAVRNQLRRDIGLVDEQNELSTLFDQLGMAPSDALGLQLHYFEEVFEGDKDELESEGGLIFVIDQLAKEIADLLLGSPALQWFPDILRDMKLLRTDGEPASITWRLVDLWVQKLVSTQCPEGTEIGEFANDVAKSLLDSLGHKQSQVDGSAAGPQESLPADRDKIEQQRQLISSMKADIKKLKAGKKEFERSQVILDNLRAELERESAEHQSLARELQGLRGQLTSSEESQSGLKAALDSANERLRAAETAVAASGVDEETKQKLSAAEKAIASLEAELTAARQAAAASSAPAAVVVPAPVADNKDNEKLVEQVKQLEAELAKAQAAVEALKAAPSAAPVAAAPSSSPEDAQKIKGLEAELAASQARMLKLESELSAALAAASSAAAGAGAAAAAAGAGGPPPPPPPPPPGGPPPPPGGGPPPPPPPPGGPPPPPGGPPPPPGGPPPPPGGPPPPPGGPPPPPGGPPGSGPPAAPAMGRPKKAQPKPPVKMRVFNWVKLADAKVDNTWWDTKITDTGVQVPTAELDALFGLVEKPAADEGDGAASSSGAGPRGVAKQVKLTVLEGNRANNVNIVMNRFNKVPIETVKTSILEGDAEFLSADNIKALLVLAPTAEEVSAIAEHADDPNLGPAEQFLWALSKIPQLQTRLETAQLASAFERRYEEINESLTAVKNATEEVSISRKLIELLRLVLAIGNYINGSTPRGGAYGIKLASLGKLADVRSGTGETLVHYLASLCEKSHPELLTIAEDMPSLGGAARENLNDVTTDAQNLNNEVQTAGNKLNGVADGPFKNRMQAFLSKAAPQVEQLVATVTKTKTSFSQLLTNLGELPDSSTADFFTLINNFVVQFTRALAENKQRAENERKKAEMAAKRAAQQAASGKAPAGSSGDAGSEGGVLDGMLAQAAAGGVARLRPAPGRGGPMPGMGIPMGVDLRAGLRKAGGGPPAGGAGAPAEAAAPIDFRAGLKKRTDGAASSSAASSSTPADAPAIDFRAGLRKRAPTDEQPKEAPAPATDFRANLKKRTDAEE